MASAKSYTVEEVLNFTVENLQGLSTLAVEGWSALSSKKREECFAKLRELKRQRDETVQSEAVDANELEEKLREIASRPEIRSSSPSSGFTTPPYDEAASLAEYLQAAREAYDTLVAEGGIPSHPLDLGFNVLDNPGEYKDIVSYWKPRCSGHLFLAQLREWREFREQQLKIRRYFLHKKKFPEYQQQVLDRRRRHGLEGDAQVHQDRDQQSKLQNWMEYQTYQCQTLETREKELAQAHEELESASRALKDAGVPGFESVYKEGNSGNLLKLSFEIAQEYTEANTRTLLATERVNFATKRLQAAQSDAMGVVVERAAWIRLAEKEVESAKLRLDQLEKSQTKPPRDWAWAPWQEWCSANRALEWAEKGVQAAQSDEFGERVEKAALVGLVQRQVDSAQAELDEATKSRQEVSLRGDMLGALKGLENTGTKLELHKHLVDWIEARRRELAVERATADEELEGRSCQKETREYATPSFLRPVHTSTVSKTGQKRATKLRVKFAEPSPAGDEHGVKLGTEALSLRVPSASQSSTKASAIAKHQLRRSTRVSKRPDRFVPG